MWNTVNFNFICNLCCVLIKFYRSVIKNVGSLARLPEFKFGFVSCMTLAQVIRCLWAQLLLVFFFKSVLLGGLTENTMKGTSCYSWYVVQFSCSVMSDSLQPHELQHARPPCPSPTPRVYPNPCPSSWRCQPAISSSVVPFSSCPKSLPASRSFPMSQLFSWGGQSIGVSASASVLPMNTQDWSPLGWTGWICS